MKKINMPKKYKIKPLTRNEEMKCMMKIKEILGQEIKPYWPRDQQLHDMANTIASRMIEKSMTDVFGEDNYHIIEYDFETQTPAEANPYSMDSVIGYVEFLRGVLTWNPPPEKANLPINLELKYIFSLKRKYIMAALEKTVFADGFDFDKMLSV
jgi:hypothetical protein